MIAEYRLILEYAVFFVGFGVDTQDIFNVY